MAGKREIIILSKADTVSEAELQVKKAELEEVTGKEVLVLSVIDDGLMKSFSERLSQELA